MILVNNDIEYYIGDSKMEELISWLDKNGEKLPADSNEDRNAE